MTRLTFLASRFGVSVDDLRDVARPATVTTFSNVHQGRASGYSYTGPKWRCNVCGRTGYADQDPSTLSADRWGARHGWWNACERGHSPCPWCGRQLTLLLDGTPRVHARCPNRPDDVELLRLATAEARDTARLGVRGPLTRDATALLALLTNQGPRP